MIHAVGHALDMAVKHRASAALTELVPLTMHVEVFLGGFLAFGDLRTDVFAKDFRAAAGERVESGGFQFNQCLFDGFFGEPREMQNLNRGEAF